ncbi:MAG: pyridoxamine 5'-phosphate oxidase family protein [Dehalococcoidia bacterium]
MSNKKENPQQSCKVVLDFMKTQKAAIVSTADTEGVPWAAPVFYIHDGFQVYWLTNPSNRLGSYLRANPRAVLCILAESLDWQKMQGLQMEGTVGIVESRREQLKALRLYVKRFAGLSSVLLNPAKGGGLIGKAASMRFYRFTPSRCWFTDHQMGFAHRTELALSRDEKTGGIFAERH